MNQMMDWGPNGWIFLLIGGLLFFFVVLILLYFMSQNHRKEVAINSNVKAQNLIKNSSDKGDMEKSDNTGYFCPNCGGELESKDLKYCPFCGTKIL